jgi:hypothetical protein
MVKVNNPDPLPDCDVENLEETHRVTFEGNYSIVRKVWCLSTFSYIVHNIGSKKIWMRLQDSPDGVIFIDEDPEYELIPDQAMVLVSNHFIRFSRLKFRLDPSESGAGKVHLWLQGRR